MSDSNTTRSRQIAGNPHYREAARASIALARAGQAPTFEQRIALERIRVRMHGRANRHEIGTWHDDPIVGGREILTCSACGRSAFLSRDTGVAVVTGILEACK